jgi:glyoxylase-like metal-dependent hydrolase (beta-lactamase superfamily II)
LLPVADRWFVRRTFADGVTLVTEPHVDRFLRCNVWHVRGRDRDLVVDTGLGIASLTEASTDLFDKPVVAVATHSHMDHTGSLHEFAERWVHALEADVLERGSDPIPLDIADFDDVALAMMRAAGYAVPAQILTALPRRDFAPRRFVPVPAPPTRRLVEGNVVDLGDRAFEVLHLPGHSPGSIGLWERRTGILFSGDALYDGPLLDELPGSDIAHYVATMRRLRDWPVTVVHGGHEASFGRARLVELVDAYLERRA